MHCTKCKQEIFYDAIVDVNGFWHKNCLASEKPADTQPLPQQQPLHNPPGVAVISESSDFLTMLGSMDSWEGIRYLKERYFGSLSRVSQYQFLRHTLEKEPDYFHQLFPATLHRWAYHLYRSLDRDQLVRLHLLSRATRHSETPNHPISDQHFEIEMIGMSLFPDLAPQFVDQNHESRTKWLRLELENIQKELAQSQELDKQETLRAEKILKFQWTTVET